MFTVLNIEINGRPAGIGDLHRAATWNYGHFTSMQAREGEVPGIELHLRRLARASRELFAAAPRLDEDLLRGLIRQAVGDHRAASVRVTVVATARALASTDLMVSVSDAVSDERSPSRRVRTATYERELPHLKHVATFGLTYQRLCALEAGFDDVLFVGRDGHVREGSVWNIAFWDGNQVVWPEAPMLPGITMQLLKSGLADIGVPSATRVIAVADLPHFRAAAATNSTCPNQPLDSINDVSFDGDDSALTRALDSAWAHIPWDRI